MPLYYNIIMIDNNVHTSFEDIEALQAWAETIEQEIKQITSEILPLQQRLDAAHEKLDLVRRLIHLSTSNAVSLVGNVATAPAPLQTVTLPGIEDHIEKVLRSQGKPVHISEIRASLIQMGVPLPGRGDEANIILRLRRANDRFVRTGRGTYALKEWNMPEYSPALIKKTVRKQKKAAS